MAINIRDLALLKFCNEQKFMTLDQIARMFFPENKKKYNWPMKCVRKLVNAGFLVEEKPGFCKNTLYRVTTKGAALLRKEEYGTDIGAMKRIDTRTWEHDLWVTDVRILFSRKLRLRQWTAERLLKQKQDGKVPDGIVSTYGKPDLIIEVERTLKKKHYYAKALLEICIQKFRDEEIILYITANETDMRWLMKQAGGWVRIYFATITDLREMKSSVTFVNAQGKKFTLYREGYRHDRRDKPTEEDQAA